MRRRRHLAISLAGSGLICLALTACNRNQAQQPVTGAPIAALQLATTPPPPTHYAPPASALPPPPAPARMALRPPRERYRYLTDAYDMADAFADTPPDYTVDYEGERPWIWRADDGAYRMVEWLPEGARYYYYEPGADAPFLVEDPDYTYAYDDGALVGVYTPAGVLLADRLAQQRAYEAARYYSRAQDLYRAAQRERREAAFAADWRQRAPMILAQRNRWAHARETQPEWRDWSLVHQSEEARRWAPERQHRLAYAAALARADAPGALHQVHRLPTPIRSSEPQRISDRPMVPPHANRPERQPQKPAPAPTHLRHPSGADRRYPQMDRGKAGHAPARHEDRATSRRAEAPARSAVPQQPVPFPHGAPPAHHAMAPARAGELDQAASPTRRRIIHGDHPRPAMPAVAAREHGHAGLTHFGLDTPATRPALVRHQEASEPIHAHPAPAPAASRVQPHAEAHPAFPHAQTPHAPSSPHAAAAEGREHNKKEPHDR